MSDEVVETSVDETGSVEGAEGTEPELTEVDYQALYEKEKQERENLASLIGRQGQELGELRKAVQTIQKPGEPEINPEEFFDENTTKLIRKFVDKEVSERLKAVNEEAEQRRLRDDFQSVYSEYDVTEENLTDLAYYASAKKMSLSQAAAQLAKNGIIEKRNGAAIIPKRAGVDLAGAPMGMPKVAGSKAGASLDPSKMTTEQWQQLKPEQREALLKKVSGLK